MARELHPAFHQKCQDAQVRPISANLRGEFQGGGCAEVRDPSEGESMFDLKHEKRWGDWWHAAVALMGCAALVSITPVFAHAQAGWEGETGVFVTPLAYTANVAGQKVHPVVAYHYFAAGPIIGDFNEVSTEVGFAKRFELGYTHEFHQLAGSGGLTTPTGTANLNYLWQNGFEIYNGKAMLVPENYKKHSAVPAISVGFIARTGVRNVGNYLKYNNASNNGMNNADIYAVATKVVTQVLKKVPIVLNAGVRGTNAELWGMGGNAPDWEARPFGAVAFVFTGPGKSSIVFGSEAAMQPHHPYGFTSFSDIGGIPLNIPTTLTYCARIVPSAKHRINVDFGVAQVAGKIFDNGHGTVADLQARHTWGTQLTWGF